MNRCRVAHSLPLYSHLAVVSRARSHVPPADLVALGLDAAQLDLALGDVALFLVELLAGRVLLVLQRPHRRLVFRR